MFMWYQITDQQVNLYIIAKPNAKKTGIAKITESAMYVSLHAKPHQGEANQELIHFLAELLQVPKSKIKLERGANCKHKKFSIPLNLDLKNLLEKLK